MRYDFLIDTYATERIKMISAWSMFSDDDLPVRPNGTDTRGLSFHEHPGYPLWNPPILCKP